VQLVGAPAHQSTCALAIVQKLQVRGNVDDRTHRYSSQAGSSPTTEALCAACQHATGLEVHAAEVLMAWRLLRRQVSRSRCQRSPQLWPRLLRHPVCALLMLQEAASSPLPALLRRVRTQPLSRRGLLCEQPRARRRQALEARLA
jgi:hypothetical protein